MSLRLKNMDYSIRSFSVLCSRDGVDHLLSDFVVKNKEGNTADLLRSVFKNFSK